MVNVVSILKGIFMNRTLHSHTNQIKGDLENVMFSLFSQSCQLSADWWNGTFLKNGYLTILSKLCSWYLNGKTEI